MRNRFKAKALAIAICATWLTPAFATERSGQLALDAKLALDAHFGNQAQLVKASEFLTRALAEDKTDATVYVQAARLTVKGGHVVSTRFAPGTIDAYGELLDRALALDPKNAKARILKSEYFHFKRDAASELSELDKAKETGTTDSWLLVGYGRYYASIGDTPRALQHYTEARVRGVGSTLEQRNAYIASLSYLASFAAGTDNEKLLREIADLTRNERDPRDAWALGNIAESLVDAGLFDDAIVASREALKTMNYGAGRLTLVAALYGKAAELTVAGKREDAAALLREARSYGFSRSSIVGRFDNGRGKVVQLTATLDALIK